MIVDLDVVASCDALVWVTGRGVFVCRSIDVLRCWLAVGATVWFGLEGIAYWSDRLHDRDSCVAGYCGCPWPEVRPESGGKKKSTQSEAKGS